MELIDGVGGCRDGRIETKRDNSSAQIVINGFRNTDNGNTLFDELLRNPERAVSADAHQYIESDSMKIFHDPIGDVCDFHTRVGLHRILKRVSPIRRPQNGSTKMGNSPNLIRSETDEMIQID